MRSIGALSSKIDSHAKFVIRLAEEALRVEEVGQVDTVDAVVLDAASDRFQPTNLPPCQHNRYGSGDLSGQLVDDFGLPIYRVVTRSMSMRSSQASDF